MKKPSEPDENWDTLRDKITGLGEGSIRKSYYPELQRRLAELELFRAVLDQSNDAIFLIELPAGRIADANESACQQLGCAREVLLNQPIDQLSSTALTPRLNAQPRVERDTYETQLRRCAGDALPAEITVRRVSFQSTDYAVVVARDITERQRAEAALRRQHRMNEAFFSQATISFVLLNRNYEFIRVNEAWARNFHLQVEDFPGRHYLDLFSDNEVFRSETLHFLDELVRTGKPLQVIAQPFNFPDQPERGITYWDWTLQPIFDERGEVEFLFFSGIDATGRKRAEDALRESEARFSTAFRHSPIAISMVRAADGRFVDVNTAFVTTAGYSRDEIIGRTSRELALWANPADQALKLQRLQQPGAADPYEFHLRTKSGELRIGLAATALIDLSGEKHFLSLTYDITDRKRAEEALRVREAHAQSLLRLARSLERAQTYAEASNAVLDEVKTIIGYQAVWAYVFSQDKTSASDLRLASPVQAEALPMIATIAVKDDRLFEELAQARGPVIIEDAQTDGRTNKEIVALLHNRTIVAIPVILFDGRQGVVSTGTFGDEGVRLPTKSELDYLSALASHLAVALDRIHLLDKSLRAQAEIRNLNRLYATLSGINQAIVRTRDQRQLFDETCRIAVDIGQFRFVCVARVDDQTHTLQLVASYGHGADDMDSWFNAEPTASVLRDGRVFVSNRLDQADSAELWHTAAMKHGYLSLAVLPIVVFDRVWGVIHFYSAEPAFFVEQEMQLLIELATDLAYAVESLQRDEQRRQAEEAMRQVQKMESIGVLAGGIAHDFNNLLVAILGQASLALEQLPAENVARGHVEKAVGAAQRAADLTRQLLAYSGRGQFQILPLNLNALIQENLHLFEVAIPKNVRLVSELMGSLPFIDGDVGQLQQVVMNLIINAAEAIGLNPGTVAVTTTTDDVTPGDQDLQKYTGSALTPGRYVALSVKDNGSGMDAATLSKVFDPFFTTKVTGRGLGLAAVLGIVRGHRGGLRVASQIGQGTTFTLYFPVSAAQPAASSAVHGQRPTIAPGLVLVIDDEESVREAVTDILEAEGHTVITAVDGETGIALYRERQAEIRLVLLDLSMPGMSGEATLGKLREVNSNVAVLLSSGYHPSEVARRFSDYGSVGFLQKPYDMTTLLREIQRYLQP